MAEERLRPDWIFFPFLRKERIGVLLSLQAGDRGEIFIKVGSDMNKNRESSSDNPRVASAPLPSAWFLTKTAL